MHAFVVSAYLHVFSLTGYDASSGHDDEKVANVGNVGYAPEGVIHHNFLHEGYTQYIILL